MKIINLLAILTFTALTSPLHAMLKRDDLPILAKRLEQDVQKVEVSENPDQIAKTILNEANRWNYNTAHYVCEAAKQKYNKTFTALLDAGASIKSDTQTAMDASLRANFIDGIDELFKRDQPYDCAPQSLSACGEETLMHFVQKVHESRKDNNKELQALSDAVVVHCDPKIAHRFIKEHYSYYYAYNPSSNFHQNEVAVAKAFLNIHAQNKAFLNIDAQNSAVIPPKIYAASKRIALHDAINNVNNEYTKAAGLLNTFKGNTQAVRDVLHNHPILFSRSDKLDIDLAHLAYALGIRHDDDQLLKKLADLSAPMPDANELSTHMLRRLSKAVTPTMPLSASCPQMVEWCLKHNADLNLEVSTTYNYFSQGDWHKQTIKCDPLKSIIELLPNHELEIRKLYALMKNHDVQLSEDKWLEFFQSKKYWYSQLEAMITFLSTEDEEVLRKPKIALWLCGWAEDRLLSAPYPHLSSLIDRLAVYTPAGHYNARKCLAAAKNLVSSQPSRSKYLALPTSESAALTSELVAVNNSDDEKKNQ